METINDEIIRIRKVLFNRQIAVDRKVKTLSKKLLDFGMDDIREEMHKKMGEKEGLSFAMKIVDNASQLDMGF